MCKDNAIYPSRLNDLTCPDVPAPYRSVSNQCQTSTLAGFLTRAVDDRIVCEFMSGAYLKLHVG